MCKTHRLESEGLSAALSTAMPKCSRTLNYFPATDLALMVTQRPKLSS